MEGKEEKPQKSFSCTPALDKLWFCYSPVFQLREYYREGTFDPCTDQFWNLMECFRLKTLKLSEAEAILDTRKKERVQPQLWETRTKEEATEAWNKEFPEMQEE